MADPAPATVASQTARTERRAQMRGQNTAVIRRPGLFLALTLLLAACGPGGTSSTPRFGDGPNGSTPSPTSILDLNGASLAAPVATDTTLKLDPQLYADAGNPCASVTTTTILGSVDPDCASNYVLAVNSPVVAGRQILDNSAEPKQTYVEQGVAPATAQAEGDAFFVSESLRVWGISLSSGNVVSTIDGLNAGGDPILRAVTAKKMLDANFPPCIYPTSTRVITVDAGARSAIAYLGWPSPSTSAVVATYAACPGATLRYADGTSQTVLQHAKAVSVVVTGHVADVSPFGPIWVEDGWAPCDSAPQLKTACA